MDTVTYNQNYQQREFLDSLIAKHFLIKIKSEKLSQDLSDHNKLKIRLNRELPSDILHFDFEYQNTTGRQIFIVVQINNDILPVFDSWSVENKFSFYSGKELDKKTKIKNYKFQDIRHINVDIYQQNGSQRKLMWANHIEINHLSQANSAPNTTGKYNVSFPKMLDFDINPGSYQEENDSRMIDFEYVDLYFKAKKLLQNINNKDIYDISGAIKNGNRTIRPVYFGELKNFKVKQFIVNGEVFKDVNISLNIQNSQQLPTGEFVIGQIEILSPFYYDYQKRKTVSGFNLNSDFGYMIPLDFSGILSHTMAFSIFDEKSIFIVGYQQEIKRPLLNIRSGLVKLKIEKDVATANHMYWLKIKNADFYQIYQNELTLDNLIDISRNNANAKALN
ncbi:MHO_1580 family protein [Mycoplasma sp. 4044]